MAEYTPQQLKYIESVGGKAHMSAVKIIGELERWIEDPSSTECGGNFKCDRWVSETRLLHHDENGKSGLFNTFKFCPWCGRPRA